MELVAIKTMGTSQFIIGWTLTVKTVLSVAVASFLAFPPFAVYSITANRDSITSSFVDKAVAISRLLDSHVREASDFADRERLWDNLQKTLWLNPDVLWIDINERLGDGITTTISSRSEGIGRAAGADNLRSLEADEIVHETVIGEAGRLLKVISPIHVGKRIVGTFEMWMTLELVDTQVERATVFAVSGYVALVAVFCGILFVSLRVTVIRPIHKLIGQVRMIAAGDLGAKAFVAGDDELSSLAASLNSMADAIKIRDSELEARSRILESMNLELQGSGKNLEKALVAAEEAEQALRVSEERLRAWMDNSHTPITLKDMEGRYLLANKRFGERFNVSREEIVGKTAYDIFPPDYADEVSAHDRKVLETGTATERETQTPLPDGTTRTIIMHKFPIIRPDGGYAGVGTIQIDITERKEAEAQLIQASKLATLGEMASGIAHELNQPLSVVGMAAELSLMSMEEGEFDTEFVRKKLETIVRQRGRMAKIVNHMRLFSRRDEAKPESFDPLKSVRGAVGLIAKQFEASGIELETTVPAACRNVSGNATRLEQVMLNLLTNARDAVLGNSDSAESGKSNSAPTVRVSLVDDKRCKTVVISVADNGGGIPEAALERIFDPFFTTKPEGHGTGLGLSISYSIIDAMGGRLEAENADGGAMFRISLPVPANGAGAVDRGKGKKQKTRTKRPQAWLPRVLIVDDEQAIAAEVADYLRRKGYEVVTAGNAVEALELHASRPADMVITDLLMPGMGGNELIRRLRQADPELPIIVMTGHTTFGDDRKVVIDGASAVLKKPIVLQKLTESLKKLRRR